MRCVLLLMISILTPAVVHLQEPSRPLVTVCEVIRNPKKYHKKVIYMKAIMDAHAEGASFKPDRGCSAFEGIVFATDEDFKQVNDPFISDKFWAALEPASAIEKERPGFSRYCCVLRTDVTVKGYFLASNKLEFGRNNTHTSWRSTSGRSWRLENLNSSTRVAGNT